MLSSSTKAADQEPFVALSNATQRYEISSSHYSHATRWSVAKLNKINDREVECGVKTIGTETRFVAYRYTEPTGDGVLDRMAQGIENAEPDDAPQMRLVQLFGLHVRQGKNALRYDRCL